MTWSLLKCSRRAVYNRVLFDVNNPCWQRELEPTLLHFQDETDFSWNKVKKFNGHVLNEDRYIDGESKPLEFNHL